ncbi:MAG: transcription termination factor NusA [Elusimicrobiota bacterium]
MESNLKAILEQIEQEKGISSEELIAMIESALTSAFKKHGESDGMDYIATVDKKTGAIKVYAQKTVVTKVKDKSKEIDKISAMKIDPAVKTGESVNIEVPADMYGRIAAQTAKQIIIQKMRENERDNIYREYHGKEGTLLTGTVYRFTNNACIVEIGKTEAILPEREQIRHQKLTRGDSIKVYIVEVLKSSRGPRILVSRTHPGLVECLFRLEVPEISEGVVEIKKIVRDPGVRCKVAVQSHNPRVDPIGACVGINGVRVQSVINELSGERMDLIKYSDDINDYLANSLSPAKTEKITIIDEENREARIIVSDDMLSLAIGKSGQNVRLAARLTNWHIDIQSASQIRELQTKKETAPGKQVKPQPEFKLNAIPGVGSKTVKILEENGFETVDKIKKGGIEVISALPGIGKKTAEKIIKSINEV